MKVDACYDRGMKVYLFLAKKRYEGRHPLRWRYEGIPLLDEKEV